MKLLILWSWLPLAACMQMHSRLTQGLPGAATQGIVMSCPMSEAVLRRPTSWKSKNMFNGFVASARMLRKLGCSLPIYNILNESEVHFTAQRCREVEEEIPGVSCMSMMQRRSGYGFSKIYAVEAAPLDEVMFLDCDAFFVRDPTGLFQDGNYTEMGAQFWPGIRGGINYVAHGHLDAALRLVPQERQSLKEEWWFRHGYESGFFMLDKRKSTAPLSQLLHIVDTFNKTQLADLSMGDKDLWHAAWLIAGPLCTSTSCNVLPTSGMTGECTEDGNFHLGSLVMLDRIGQPIVFHQLHRFDVKDVDADLVLPKMLASVRVSDGTLTYDTLPESSSCTLIEQTMQIESLSEAVSDMVLEVSHCWRMPDMCNL